MIVHENAAADNIVSAAFIDFFKMAFNAVEHSLLSNKLYGLGFNGEVIKYQNACINQHKKKITWLGFLAKNLASKFWVGFSTLPKGTGCPTPIEI